MRPHLQASARSSVRDSKNALNVVLLLLTPNLFICIFYSIIIGPLTGPTAPARVTIGTIASDHRPHALPPGNVLYAEFYLIRNCTPCQHLRLL